jgi:DNA-binding PucR family transcriptional regulator
MSVAIADLMRLPCLREAKVLGGHGGLQKTINTISVLEYTEANELQEYLFNSIEFLGSELVITCFANVRDNVEAQCLTMRRLAEAGETGLILYYVGIFMPKVDAKLIELADRLEFPLICMPENQPNLRYSEVIGEVMGAIFKDRMTDTNFQAEIIERISRLPIYQRSIGTAMRMLSDRVRVSLILTDLSGNLLSGINWPRTLEIDTEKLIKQYNQYNKKDAANNEARQIYIKRYQIDTSTGSRLHLYIIKQDEPIREEDGKQIVNTIKICLNLWSQKYSGQALPELVQAILQDEPLRMRRIAQLFKIDIASIHNMWIITPVQNRKKTANPEKDPQMLLNLIREELSPYCKTIIADIYNQDIVAFMDDPSDGDLMPLADSLNTSMKDAGISAFITVCINLKETAQVRRSYLRNKNALNTARLIYPRKKIFTREEIVFADTCQDIIARGEGPVKEAMAVLDSLNNGDERQIANLYETLTVYLLEAESSLEKCAALMFLHRNSIKYRISQINDLVGFKIGRMPETMAIYTAAALKRILDTQNRPDQR